MTRKRMTASLRLRVFDNASGRCHLCGNAIDTRKDRWDVDHDKPLWLGGQDAESNMRPVHARCHVSKTASEAPVRAKSTRVRAKHLGIRMRKGRPMPGTKASGLRKRMDGTVERRDGRR